MKDYDNELKYFYRTYDRLVSHEISNIKEFMLSLLECSSSKILEEFYYTESKKYNLIFPQLEKDIKEKKSLVELKFRIVSCAVNKLHSAQRF